MAGEMGARVARGLLLGSAIATIWTIDNGRLSWGTCEQPTPFVLGSVPLLLWASVWYLFKSAAHRVAPVRIGARLRSALTGTAAAWAAAALCWFLIRRLAAEPNYYPERYVDSQSSLVSEALGVGFFGTVVALLLPSRLYAAEARDPIRAVLASAAMPLVALALYWVPLKYSITHVGSPRGWGRLVILNLAFGLGWVASAGPATCATPATDDGAVLRHKPFHDVVYVTAVVSALGLALLVIGGLLDGHQLGLYVFSPIVVLTGLLSVHWRAPRSESGAAELVRSVFLSLPIALPLTAAAASLVAAGASMNSSAPSFLLVPLPFAAAGTLWLIGLLAILSVRLEVTASR